VFQSNIERHERNRRWLWRRYRAIAVGVRFGCILADAGYGLSAPFRQGLTARKLAWAVGIPRHLKVYPADVQMIWPVAGRGRPRQRHVPDCSLEGCSPRLPAGGRAF
jgi:DDE superfamily endonuclease